MMKRDNWLQQRYGICSITCKYCGSEMIVDDVDFQFKGCMDIYDECENCGASAIRKVRYSNICKTTWRKKEVEE